MSKETLKEIIGNTYVKYCPGVFLAKCVDPANRGDVIEVLTKYGKPNRCVVYNLIFKRDEYYYYSIVREDGFDSNARALKKAERYATWEASAEKKSESFYNASNKDKDFLSLGEPIKIGHHSERRHRKIIEQAWNNMGKSVAMQDKAAEHKSKAEYWLSQRGKVDISMPESIAYYEFELEKAKEEHQKLLDNKELRSHSYSLTYAKKKVKEMEAKAVLALKLWGY